MKNIAINGAGEIGQNLLRENATKEAADQLPINKITDGYHTRESLFVALHNNPVRGIFPTHLDRQGTENILIDNNVIAVQQMNDSSVPEWSEDTWGVFEATGQRVQERLAQEHIGVGGVKKVLVTAPTKGDEGIAHTLIPGYNEAAYDPRKHDVITNESCTTKSAIHVLNALNEYYGVKALSLTTVHAETGGEKRELIQNGIDPAALNQVGAKPRSTGSQGALSKLFPEVKVSAEAYRIPTADASITDMTFKLLKRCESEEELIPVLEEAQAMPPGLWEIVDSIRSSAEIIGNPNDAVVARDKIRQLDVNTVRVAAGYDNAYAPTRSANDAMRYMLEQEG